MRFDLDIASLTGMEIGPLADPIVRKSEGRIIYVDYTRADTLRAKYANDPLVNVADIVDIDVIWGEQTLAQGLGSSERVIDYVLASHVAEHVPDLITWLNEIHAILRPSGQLRLALPDKRFSADALRDETGIADLLAAWLLRARRPQVRDVLDFRLHHAPSVDGWGIYNGVKSLSSASPLHSFQEAIEAAEHVRDSDFYHDVHCTVVQPRTFARLMRQLAEYGVLKMACADMIDSSMPLMEFYVFMRPCNDPAEAAASWDHISTKLQDPLFGSAAAREKAQQATELQQLRAELAKAKARVATLEAAISDGNPRAARRLLKRRD
jgi:SAM-dependent methyltransferase